MKPWTQAEAVQRLQAIQDERERKQKASAGLQEEGQKTFGGDKKKASKAATLENDVAALDAAAQAAQAEYDKITQRNQQVGGCGDVWLMLKACMIMIFLLGAGKMTIFASATELLWGFT